MPQASSRKRPAPGASPLGQNQMQIPMNYTARPPQPPSDQFLNWGTDIQSNNLPNYPDPSANFSPVLYNTMAPQGMPSEASNQLARRPVGQHMVARGTYNTGGNEGWDGTMESGTQQPAEESWNDDDAALAQKALVAEREAKSKRKSIPPFVQKLSSFLDESRNTDLIRWSTSGNSFIVLDEDEFAKTLIPELFKHNNYASFVRQLNMYGFHKKVGLSDNSMRASERKNKTPNEYYNPYFKRGKQNLLWLIQKPKPAQGKGKGGSRLKQEEDIIDDDVDEPYEVETSTPNQQGTDNNTPGLRNTRQPLLIGQGTPTSPQTELSAVHHELEQIRQQQRIISGVIQKIKQDHQNLYGQAAAFQELHTRHENSINAILTFLATVYNRSLEGQTNIQNLFAGAIPADLQRQGSVVDVGDYSNTENSSLDANLRRPIRRFPLLLNAPPARTPEEELNLSASPSPAPSTMSAPQRTQNRSSMGETPGNLMEQTDSASLNPGATQNGGQSSSSSSSESPHFSASNNASGSVPETDIMSFINSANANDAHLLSNSRMDFPQALSHLQTADGKSPLSTNERNNVLQLMANGSAKAASNGNTLNNNNALMSPNPPDLPVPNIEHWNATQHELDFLEKTLKEQDSKVANLSTLLQPLSPSGRIPGLSDPVGYNGLGPTPSDILDFDNVFDSNDYFGDPGPGQDLTFGADAVDFNGGADFDFATPNSNDAISGLGFDGSDDHDDGRRFETVDSSVATSPANTVVDGGGGGGGGGGGERPEEEGNTRKKRRRK